MRDQRDTARRLGATAVHAVATEALRSAANGVDLVAAIQHATGLTVEVLTPAEEARLAFVGVAGTLGNTPPDQLGVVDVGGGSSELVVRRGSEPRAVVGVGPARLGRARARAPAQLIRPRISELSSARDADRRRA